MYLHRNFSFNQKNITHKEKNKDKQAKKKTKNNIIRLKNNFNFQKNQINNNNNKMNIEEDISLYTNIATLKNQIFSPENDEDIYIYNNNKKMEKKIIYEDEKNSNYFTTRNIRTKNLSLNENSNNKYNNNKKTLILDLDETLVHSLFKPEQVNNNIINPDIYLKIFFNNKYQEIFVYKRPFLDIFLKEMNKLFNIYVFTASIELYAKPLLDKLDKNNLIKKKFYRESCIFSEGKFIKNLNSLNLNLKLNDVIIIDNNPFSFKFNKNNGIPIKSWHFDKSDAELIKIIPLLKYLSKTYDVRKYIPHIITNDEINFENINSILQKKQVKIYKTINYNNDDSNAKNSIMNNNYHHNPNTINYREPQVNKRIIIKNFNKRNNVMNSNNMIYRNNSIGINFNSNELNNKDKFLKSYNNFYINSKYSFVISQEKENEKNCETNLNNLISDRFTLTKKSKKKKNIGIPFDTKSLNKIYNNRTSRIYKSYKNNINNNVNNNLIRHCSSHKNINSTENKNNLKINPIKSLIKTNNNYIQLKKNNTIEASFQQKNNPYMINLIKTKYYQSKETNLENKKQKMERLFKNGVTKRRIKLKNVIHRNGINKFNQNMKSFSYSNLNFI